MKQKRMKLKFKIVILSILTLFTSTAYADEIYENIDPRRLRAVRTVKIVGGIIDATHIEKVESETTQTPFQEEADLIFVENGDLILNVYIAHSNVEFLVDEESGIELTVTTMENQNIHRFHLKASEEISDEVMAKLYSEGQVIFENEVSGKEVEGGEVSKIPVRNLNYMRNIVLTAVYR